MPLPSEATIDCSNPFLFGEKNMSTKLFLRVENNDAAAVDVSGASALAAESDAKLDAEAVTAAAADVTELDTGIDNALEAAGEVEAVTDVMAESVAEDEGLTPREAELVEARLEAAAKLVGADLGAMGLTFRRESFGGKESRLSVTKMRLEAAEGFGKKIWENIKKAWNWLKDAAINLFGKLTKSADSQVSRLKDLEARANNIKGKQKESKMKTAVSVFSVNGTAGFNTMLGMADQTEKYEVLFANIFTKLKPGNIDASMDGEKINAAVGSVNQALFDVVTAAFGKEETISKKGIDNAAAYGRLPGGRSILVRKNEGSGDDAPTATFEVAVIDEKIAEDYAALSADEIRKVIARAKTAANGLKSFKTNEASIKKLIEGNIAWLDNMTKVAETDAKREKSESGTSYAAAIRALVRSNQSLVKAATTQLPTAYFNIVAGMADAAAAGISNFKED